MKYRQRCSIGPGVDILLKLPGKYTCVKWSQWEEGIWPGKIKGEKGDSAWVIMGKRIWVSFSHYMSQHRYVYGVPLLISNKLPCACFVSSLTTEIFYSNILDRRKKKIYVVNGKKNTCDWHSPLNNS